MDEQMPLPQWEELMIKRGLIQSYECPDCGANSSMPASQCCDSCIMKFFLEDTDAPAIVWDCECED